METKVLGFDVLAKRGSLDSVTKHCLSGRDGCSSFPSFQFQNSIKQSSIITDVIGSNI